MRKDDIVRLRHRLDAAREAQGFAATRSRSDLDRERQLLLALVKAVEIIGEAATRVSTETRLECPEISGQDIVAMCLRLTHGYYDIDLDTVMFFSNPQKGGLAENRMSQAAQSA